MPGPRSLELAATAYKIVKDLVALKPGESLLITIDSAGVWRVAEETAKAAEALGAKVMVAWHSTPPGYGKVGDPFLPDSLKAAIPNTDIWIEYNYQWLLYGQPWEDALKEAKRVRYLFLGGLNEEQIIRTIGKVDLKLQEELQIALKNMTQNARMIRMQNSAGTDVTFTNAPGRPVNSEGWARSPGATFLLGQIGWAPLESTVNGTIVFDGSFSGGGEAEIGILNSPIRLSIHNGVIGEITGSQEADFIRNWLTKLSDPRMYNVAHVCYGFNPGAHLSGLCTEDERVWGSTEWGFGNQGPNYHGSNGPAITHFDGICLKSTVWLDGELLIENGELKHPELAKLAHQLGH